MLDKKQKISILAIILSLMLTTCTTVKNFEKPEKPSSSEGRFFRTHDGLQLFVYEYLPEDNYDITFFVISGISGINHHREMDIIRLLANDKNRVVVIHPRGTGYSEGRRGDIDNFTDFITDYAEIISSDVDYRSGNHNILMFGHSMSTAILLAVADKLDKIGGAILVNPPLLLKHSKGMSPGFFQYCKYAWYYAFARHKPVVNMAGEPSHIASEEDRKESEQRISDPILVKTFSMHMMLGSKKVMDSMMCFSKSATYPLLLLYGAEDNLVDIKGCKMIYDAWQCKTKEFVIIQNGSHGKSTVLLAKGIICDWIRNISGS